MMHWTSPCREPVPLPRPDLFKLVLDLTVQEHPLQHVRTCSTWTSLYRNTPSYMFKLVQLIPHCTGTTPPTCSNLFNLEFTVQGHPLQHVQTCSTWTSLYRDTPSNMFELVQLGTHCTGTPPPTCSNLFNLYLTVQGQPLQHVRTCSTYTSLYRNTPSNMFELVQLGTHCTGTPPPTCSNLFNLYLTVQGHPVQHVRTCSTWNSLYIDHIPTPPQSCIPHACGWQAGGWHPTGMLSRLTNGILSGRFNGY